MEINLDSHPFLFSLILCHVDELPDDEIAVGLMGVSDDLGESLVTPFPDGILEVFELTEEEHPFEEYWTNHIINEHLTESKLVDKYFNSISVKGSRFYISEPFVAWDVALTQIAIRTEKLLADKGYRISIHDRFERVLG